MGIDCISIVKTRKWLIMNTNKLIVTVGFAIFAMFFGAGNLVFPLATGAHAGHHLLVAIIGFFLAGVLVPFLGLYAISLYHGSYLKFLSPIGAVPGFIVAFLLIFLIGIIVGTPRTSVLAYGTFKPFFPHAPATSIIFNAVFFSAVFFFSMYQYKIIDLLGYVLSPVKVTVLVIVIIAGLFTAQHLFVSTVTSSVVFEHAVKAGYGTMDLLAAFFFCAFVYKVIRYKTRDGKFNDNDRAKLTLKACFVGSGLITIIYLGFMWVANQQALHLQHVPTESMIGAIAKIVLPKFAAIFVCVCVTLACFSTALAVNAVTVDFFKTQILKDKIPYVVVLAVVTFVVFIVSDFGFAAIMRLAVPVLSVLYPALIALTICNILTKIGLVKSAALAPVGFYAAFFLTIVIEFI